MRDRPATSPHGQVDLFFELDTDLGEKHNLAADHPEVVRRLKASLKEWTSDLADPRWPSNRSTMFKLGDEWLQLFF